MQRLWKELYVLDLVEIRGSRFIAIPERRAAGDAHVGRKGDGRAVAMVLRMRKAVERSVPRYRCSNDRVEDEQHDVRRCR